MFVSDTYWYVFFSQSTKFAINCNQLIDDSSVVGKSSLNLHISFIFMTYNMCSSSNIHSNRIIFTRCSQGDKGEKNTGFCLA